MPHDADPERFAKLLTEFWETTEPAQLAPDFWQPLMDDDGS